MSEYTRKYAWLQVTPHRPVIVAVVLSDTNTYLPSLVAKGLLVEMLFKSGLDGPELGPTTFQPLLPTFQPLLTNSDRFVRGLAQEAWRKLQRTNMLAFRRAP